MRHIESKSVEADGLGEEMKNVMVLTEQEDYGTRLSRELGRLLGAEWQCGYFSGYEKLMEWCGRTDTMILYFEDQMIEGDFCEEYLWVPLLSERPEVPYLRFICEERNCALPGLFRYRKAEEIAADIKDVYTLWEMRRRGKKVLTPEENETRQEPAAEDGAFAGKEFVEDEVYPGVEERRNDCETEEEEIPRWVTPNLSCVLSPQGGSGVTTFAGALALEFGKRERTVLVCYDPYCGMEYGEGRDISEALYLMEEYGDEWEQDFGKCSRLLKSRFLAENGDTELWVGPRVIAGMASEEDLWMWDEHTWEQFLSGLKRLSVNRVVIDLGPGVMISEALLQNSSECVLVGEAENTKVRRWLRDHASVREKTTVISMAEIPGKGGAKRPNPEKKAEEYVRGLRG